MTKLSAFDCDDCRECLHRRVFDQGVPWCVVTASYCPQDGCEFGLNKEAVNIHD